MVDPETFLKNSPFYVSHGEQYNLLNTTPDLLKFQLHEQNRNSSSVPPAELLFSSYLQQTLGTKPTSLSDSDESDSDDATSTKNGALSVSTPSSEISENNTASKDHLNLKILIENSVFDTLKISTKAIMPLLRTKKIKEQIADKQELKDYLQEKIALLSQFCSTLMFNSEPKPDLDIGLVLKIMKQNHDLQQLLTTITNEIDMLRAKLNDHNLACLVLGYVEDIRHSASTHSLHSQLTRSPTKHTSLTSESDKLFDALFSYIASLAVQNNVTLPEHPQDADVSLENRIQWAQDCIGAVVAARQKSNITPPTSASVERSKDHSMMADDNSVLQDHSFLSASPYKGIRDSAMDNKTISEYRVALNDLRFSHQYFMKEYDYLKENSLKTISEYRKKNAALEKEVARLRAGGSSVSLDSLASREANDLKDKEIARLRKELNLLKIDTMGNKLPRSLAFVSPSLLSGLNAEEDEPNGSTLATSPGYSGFLSMGGNSMSNAILRKEFKKIVSDIQDQYEVELGKERLRRRQLEEKLSATPVSNPTN